ncbi:MAG: F0F1 ATP synthase subunit B [Clostridiales bacterium]|nr:F0F1 ATP synthase subunit B [Clostridiales bacterium]
MQSLDIISVNIWQILISLINLLIMFRILKKFLFKPVTKVVHQRQEQVQKLYSDADASLNSANQLKEEYEQRLASARQEADSMIKTAAQTAQQKGDQILSEAKSQAGRVKQKAEEEIAQQKQQMLKDVRGEISGLAVDIASKVVEREVNQQDYEGFVDDFIRNVGEAP